MLRQCADLYAELIKAQITPVEADTMELWQIAALMNGKANDASTRTGEFTSRPTSTGESLIAARVQAAREGREIDSRDYVAPIEEDEMSAFLNRNIPG